MNPGYYGGSGDEYSGSSGSWGWGLDIIPVDILKNGVVYGKIKNIKENGKTYLGVKVQEIPKADLVNEFKSKNGFVNYVREKWKPRGFELHERGKSSYLDRLEESASNLYRTKTHNCF